MEAEQQCPPVTSIDRLETIYSVPTLVGSGYSRDIKLYPSLELCIFHETYRDLTIKVPENRHLVQFKVLLSGVEDSGNHVLIDAKQSYVGGSGIQRRLKVFSPQCQPQIGINIHIQPHLLSQFFATPTTGSRCFLPRLRRRCDWWCSRSLTARFGGQPSGSICRARCLS